MHEKADGRPKKSAHDQSYSHRIDARSSQLDKSVKCIHGFSVFPFQVVMLHDAASHLDGLGVARFTLQIGGEC
jgi:hypothetical protein